MSHVSTFNDLARMTVISTVVTISSQALAISGAGGPSADLIQPAAIGDAFLRSRSIKSTDVKLINAVSLFTSDAVLDGPYVWRLTYKYRNGIPVEADRPIAVGGEAFVEVDLRAKKATLVGVTE